MLDDGNAMYDADDDKGLQLSAHRYVVCGVASSPHHHRVSRPRLKGAPHKSPSVGFIILLLLLVKKQDKAASQGTTRPKHNYSAISSLLVCGYFQNSALISTRMTTRLWLIVYTDRMMSE